MNQQNLIKPDQVYKMLHLEDVALSPATVIRRIAPYRSDDETRAALRFITFEEDLISACDGRRFIRFDRSKMAMDIDVPDGSYRPVKDGKDFLLIAHSQQLEIPDLVDAVMPSTFSGEFPLKHFDAAGDGISELLYRLAQHKISIKSQYAEEIPFGDYTVKLGGPKQVVLLVGDYTVGIMPLNHTF